MAQKRLQETGQAIENRRKFVAGQIEQANALFQGGRFEDAAAIKKNLRKEYGAYTSLQPILPPELRASEDDEKKSKDEAPPKGTKESTDP